MITKTINNFNNYEKALRSLIPSFSGMLRVKAGRPLVGWLIKAQLLVKGSIETSMIKVSISFIRTIVRLAKRNGIPYTVKYLKACTSLLMQSISGTRHKATHELGLAISRTNFGIPRIIPRLHRSRIKKGDIFIIRLWLTFFSIYRVIDFTGKLKVGSIINPSDFVLNKEEIQAATQAFMSDNKLRAFLINSRKVRKMVPFWISTTSPNSTRSEISTDGPKTASTSFPSIMGSLMAWHKDKNLFDIGHNLAYSMANTPLMEMFLRLKEARRLLVRSSIFIKDPITEKVSDVPLKSEFLGKLAYKVEPAGKIRIFAMADPITQWLLKPLHSEIFNTLRSVPNDGTHEQNLTLRKFVEDWKQRKIKRIYSFDLTAATDRMPLEAQKIVLSQFVSFGTVELWGKLLVDRWYALPSTNWSKVDGRLLTEQKITLEKALASPNIMVDYTPKGEPYIKAIKYAVGQPMGALSSWAMLALTHHIMVIIAARRVGLEHFRDYLILGDDLVIANHAVAKSYLLVAKEWGIEINLSKSVISTNGSLEFAKRFVYKYQDVSGISFKEMAVSRHDIRGLAQLFLRISLFRKPRITEVLSYLGFGYKALSRLTTKYTKQAKGMRNTLFLFTYPGQLFSTMTTVSSWILSPSFNKGGLNNMPESALLYMKNLLKQEADNVIQPTLPRTPEEFLDLFRFSFGTSLESWRKYPPLWLHYWRALEPVWLELCFRLHENWDVGVVEVKDTFDYDDEDLDFDTLWSYMDQLEQISSGSNETSMFQKRDKIITLNRSTLLKRASVIRDKFMSLTWKPRK